MAPIGVPVEASLAVANRRSDGNSVANLLVDTGFLVALYRRNDELHQSALRFLQGNREGLITVAPVIVEACHSLAMEARVHLLQWITREGLTVFEILTVDERDFWTYRLPDRKQLQLVEWMSADGSGERR